MEKLEYKSRSSQAKLIGTLVSIAGALMITLYKGQPIQTMKLHYYNSSQTDQTLELEMTNWVIGGILCAAGSLCLAFGYIVMSWILKDYPEELMALSVSSAMGTTLCGAASLWLVHDPSAWTLRMDIGLLAIASNGVLCIALKGAVHSWALKKKGPVYVTMFKPLGMVAAMALGILFLGDSVFLGRVIGAVIIALGFYAAMWGKAQELDAVVEDHCVGECRVALLKD
ncbi:WAT1-related protein At3g28050 [Linum grandiflorum]